MAGAPSTARSAGAALPGEFPSAAGQRVAASVAQA